MDVPADTSSGLFSPCLVSERTLQPVSFRNTIFLLALFLLVHFPLLSANLYKVSPADLL
jgi:hypothetical protein